MLLVLEVFYCPFGIALAFISPYSWLTYIILALLSTVSYIIGKRLWRVRTTVPPSRRRRPVILPSGLRVTLPDVA